MREVEHFRVIEEYDIHQLESVVNSLIKKGYQPLGATTTRTKNTAHYFIQSLVKYKAEPTENVKEPNNLSYIKD